MNFDVTATGNAGSEFRDIASDVERLENRLQRLDRLRIEPSAQLNITPATRSAQQLQTRLDALRNVRAKVEVDGAADARRDVTALVVEMRKIRDVKAKIDLDTGTAKADVTTIAAKLASLRDTDVKLEVKTGQSEARANSIGNRLLAIKALSPIAVEIRVDPDDRALTRLATILAASRALSAERPRIQVTADTAGTAAQLAALLAQIRALSNAEHTVRVRMEGQSLLAQLASIQTQLNTLAGGSVEITADTRALMTQLAEARVELARLEAMDPTVVVEADTALARHRIKLLERQLHDIAAEQYTARVDVDRDGSALAKMAALSGASGILAASLGASTAAAASLAGSIAVASGALGLLPAAGAVGGAAMATFAVGLAHVSDALGPTGTAAQIKKVNEALAALSPTARAVVDQIRGLGPVWSELRLDVQEKLFAGLGTTVGELGGKYLPVLKTGLGGVAVELNTGAKGFAEWAAQGRTVDDVNTILAATRSTMRELAPAGTNVAAALTDISVVGSEIMPELAAGATAATEQFRAFIAEGRRTGELEATLRRGIETVQTFGSVLGNVGGIAVGVFDAADASGADFLGTLDRVTGGVERYVRSADGQRALIDFFSESRDVVDELTPGIAALGTETGRTVSAFSNTGGAEAFAGATSDILRTVSPLLPVLGELGGETLGNVASGLDLAAGLATPLVAGLSGILDVTGPLTPAVLALMAALGGGIAARAAVLGLSGAMATLATSAGTSVLGLTGSAAAGQAVATGMGAAATGVGVLARALPIVAIATVGLGMALDGMSVSTDDAVAALSQGGVAADNMRQRLLEQTGQIDANGDAVGGLVGSINLWANSNLFGMTSVEQATAAAAAQRSEMTTLQLAQEAVTTATGEYAQAVTQFTENSPQARAALADLNAKTRDGDIAQRAARDGTDLHTAAMREQTDQALAAENASIGYRQSILDQRQAQTDLTVAVRDHGVGSDEAQRAQLRLEQADLRVIAASSALTQETRELEGSSLSAAGAAAIETSELLGMATSADGKASPALQRMAGRLTDAQIQASNAAVATSGFHYEVRTLPDGRRVNIAVDAETGEVVDLHTRIDNLPKSVPLRFTATGEVKAPGYTGVATGGVWNGPGSVTRAATGTVLSGYTPGRDVHDFRSRTGGRLLLSGGEAIMRPEFARAVSPAWVHGANRAARQGGVGGVQSFVARTAPRASGAEGRAGDGSRFASGGVYGRPRVAPSWSVPRSPGPRPTQRFAAGGVYDNTPETATEMNRLITAEMSRRMSDKIKAMYASGSGPATAGAAAALAWARRATPRPYGWGAVGPGAYDCSGAMSALVNVMRGRNPHSRVGGTGTFPWPGFKPGIGPGLSIGSFRGDPGHMAGTIAGVNVESSGSAGFRVGGTARGAGWHKFTTKAHLADRGGMFPSGTAALNLSGRAERALTGKQNESWERLTSWLTTAQGRDYMRAPGPLPTVRPTGPSTSGPYAEQMRAALAVARPTAAARPAMVDVAPVARAVSQLQAQMTALSEAVRSARPITVEDRSGDAAETARMVQLRLRMG
jgi:uncharacterized membrane protein YkoI